MLDLYDTLDIISYNCACKRNQFRGSKMALPVSYYTETIADNTIKANGEPEIASFSVPVTTLTAANLVAQTTKINALKTAVAGVIIGNLNKSEIVLDRALGVAGPAGSVLAQRENKLLLRYHDSVTLKKFRTSVPTFDLTTLVSGSEFLDLTGGVGAALKTAFEDVVVSPDDSGHTVILDTAQFVGRNS